MRIDRILGAAEIITLDPDRPTATRIGILDGRIVGFDEELDGLDAGVVEELGDAVLVPGFIDAHTHTTWWGLGLDAVDLSRARGLDELYALLRDEATRLAERPGHWIHGTGFNQKHHGGEHPDIRVLDEIAPDRPMYLRNTSGHQAITNSAALRLAGALDATYTDPEGGEIKRDAAGYPTGVLDEEAQGVIQHLLLPYSIERIVDALDTATARYASYGITGFTEAGVGGGWIGHSPIEIAAYQRAVREGRLHARGQLMPVLDVLHPVEGHADDAHGRGGGLGLDLGIGPGFGDDRLSIGPVKVFLDGSLLGATAAATEDFCGTPHNHGYLLSSADDFRERVDAAYRAGWSVAVHAIGDAAVDLAIELITDCTARYGRNALPNRIEHCGMARPEHLPLLAAAGIAVTPQASFTGPLGRQFMERVGPERTAWLYRARSFLDAGVVVAGSSDVPVADPVVLRALQALVDRRTDEGEVFGADAECLSPLDALRTYTVGSATATGTLAERGTLTPGKLADLVVLDGSPLTAPRIDELTVLATMVGGTYTHDVRDGGRADGAARP
ncbi:amidohydrolase [Pseudoclavibacter chungangensis]|uniref:Amidohydrolase n=1 Tax=Pseudoclavibacter chungangensis TaxID=587635 RepID=A0A7J5C189_9MICO|nr:amidohydrolase [Pseudoclavibacter chungangensis]KAB1662372.1 amidohydrolase [Pseudoclavibacter chungangensis]NYJ65513.1 hypothetical protein [Pseudoclavibacter chungangensis]